MPERVSISLDPKVTEADGCVMFSPGSKNGVRMPYVDLKSVVQLQLTCAQAGLVLKDLEPVFSDQLDQLPKVVKEYDATIIQSLYWLETNLQTVIELRKTGNKYPLNPEASEAFQILSTFAERLSRPSDPTLG